MVHNFNIIQTVIKLNITSINVIQGICNTGIEPDDQLSKEDIAIAMCRNTDHFDCL